MGKGAGKGADGEGLLRRRIVERGGLGEAPAEAQSTEDFGTADAAKSGWPFAAASTTRLTMTIDGEQYDMTDYKHPGGDIIWDADQHDATSLLYSTHPLRMSKTVAHEQSIHPSFTVYNIISASTQRACLLLARVSLRP